MSSLPFSTVADNRCSHHVPAGKQEPRAHRRERQQEHCYRLVFDTLQPLLENLLDDESILVDVRVILLQVEEQGEPGQVPASQPREILQEAEGRVPGAP